MGSCLRLGGELCALIAACRIKCHDTDAAREEIEITSAALWKLAACETPAKSLLSGPLIGEAPVAQLDRAPDYESGGRAFESLRVRHLVFSGLKIR